MMDATVKLSSDTDQRLLDTIVYLSSMTSDRHMIDSLLDRVRIVTAGIKEGSLMTDQDRITLIGVRSELEDYLIHRDPIRAFTPDSLRQRVEDHFGRRKPKLLIDFFAILTVAALGYLVIFPFLPAGLSITSRALLAVPMLLAAFHIGVLWLFMSSLQDFKPALRKAVGLIAAGLVLALPSGMLFPVLFAYPELLELPIFRYGGFLPFLFVMVFFIYLGIRLMAKLLGSRSWFTSLWLYLPLQVGLAFLIAWLPHTAPVTHELFFDISVLSFALSATVTVGTLVLAVYIQRHIAQVYSRAMFWLVANFCMVIVGSIIFSVILFTNGPMTADQIGLASLPFAPSEIFLLLAGYAFRKAAVSSRA